MVDDDAPPPAYWTSTVSRIDGDTVRIRGYDLEELIGGQTFTASAFLLLRGRLPTPDEVRALDAVLNAVLDYALEKPGTVAARYTVSANPSMVAGMAAAVLAVGRFTLAPEDTARFIVDAHDRLAATGAGIDELAATLVAEAGERRQRIPGFGHPRFRRIDPRAQRLRDVAEASGLWGERARLYEAVHRAFTGLPGKADIPINDVGMMAVVLVELGFTPEEMTGLAVLSTMPGVVAHLSEELRTGRPIRVVPEDQVDYADRSERDFVADRREAGWPDGS
jgi:citryl-CoA lyase